jgi:hypothetical protein
MFESCRAHFRRKSTRFVGMTPFAGSTASSEVWWAQAGKARLRCGLEAAFYRWFSHVTLGYREHELQTMRGGRR